MFPIGFKKILLIMVLNNLVQSYLLKVIILLFIKIVYLKTIQWNFILNKAINQGLLEFI